MDQTDLENLLIGCLTTTSHKALMKNHINRPGLIKPLEFVLALLSSHAVFASGLIIPEIQAPRGNDKALVELAITDPEGSIYVAGTFVGGARFGENISLESSGQTPFVAKLNSNGQWLWARIGGNAKNTCAVVRNDELLVGGYGGSGTNAFGQIEILSANTGQVRQNIVMDHIGEGLREGWSKINTLAVARDNSIYVGGDFTKKFQVGGSLIQNTIRRANIADNQSEENNANLVIIKLDATGNYQWHVVAGSMADWGPEAKNGPATLCSTETMEVDGAGNLYAAGILRNSGSRGGVGDSINIYSKFTQVGAQSQIAWEGGVQPKNGSITWARQAVFLSKISPDGAIEYFNVHGLNHYRRASPSDSWIYSYNPAQKEDRRLFFESRDPSIHWVSSLKYSNGFLYLGGILEQFFSLERNEWENQPFLLVGDNLDLDVIARRATQKAGFVAKFRADTGLRLPTDPRVVFDDDQRRSNDSTRKNNVRRLEVGDDSVYVSGDCGTYLGVWTDIDRLPEKPDPQTNLVSLQKNIYVAALDSQLKPKWLRSTADPANVPAPNELNPSVLVWDQLNGRLWYGGSYGDSRDYPNQPELVLGGLSLKRSLKVLGRRVESFLGVLRPDGDHLESVRLLVKSRYGPLTINGFQQLGEDGGTVEVEMPRGGWLTNVVPAAVYLTRSNRLELDERRSVQLPYRTEDWSVSASDLLDSYRLVFEVGTKVTPWGIMIQSLLSESTLGLIQQRFVSVPDFGDDYLGSTDEIGAAIAAELSNQIATNRSLYLQFAELVPPEVRTPLTRAILEDGYASGHTAEASRRFLEHAQSENGAFFFRAIPESEAHYESLAKTRRISEGFTILTTGDRVAANRYSFALNSDLEIEAEWSTDHILEVANYVSDVGVANENLGNPSPAVGRHWIREGTRQDAFIDGIVNDLDPAAYGTRYLAAQYVSEGVARPPGSVESSVTVNLIEPTLLSRLQVRQFSMTGPAKITYRWEKQYRVLVSASTERANRLPFIQTNSIGFQSWGDGSGEYWLRAGAYLQIGSRSVGNNRSLSGWRNGIGEFPSLEGSLSHPRLTHLTDGGDRYFLIVTNLGRPTRVMWMFDNRVFRQDVAIGGALDLASVSLAVAAEGVGSLDPNVPPGTKTIVDAPPGSTVEDMAVWDDVGRRLYPVRPGITQFEWATDQKDNPIVVQVVSGFTGDRIPDSDSGFFPDPDGAGTDAYRYRHLTRTPGVLLDASPTDGSFFLGLRYSESDGSAAGGIFTATRPGRSVLLFSDSPIRDVAAVGNRTQEALRVRVVESRNWDRELDRISGTNRATGSWNLPWRERLLSGPVSTGIDFTHPLHLTPMPVNVVSETVVVPGDFDGDGVRDLLLLGLGQEVRLHRGGRFGESPQILSSLAETRLDSAGIAGDLDGDGDLDFVRATSAGTAYVYLNRGGPQPFLGVEPEEVAVGIPPVAMQLVELSHPGRLDLLVASGGTVLRFEGRDPAKSGPIFATERSENLAARIGVVGSVTALTVGDQDGDGKMDLVVGEENGAIHLLHGLGGKDLFAAEVEHFGTGSRIASLALGNVLGDGGQEILALVGGREGPGEIQVLDAKGGALSFNTSTNGVTSRSFALLPPDASGHSPVVFGGTGGVIQWAPGTDEERTLNSTGSVIGLGSLGVGDLDGDGLEDLYVVEKTLPQVNLFPSGGNGPLAKGPVDAAVGSALQSSFDRSLQGAAYVLPGVKSNALYNARIHPPRGVTGPIIPVNERYDPGRFDELVVAWYEVREGIEWPYQPVRYEPHWPEHPGGVGPGTGTLQRIVIASRLGSEGMTWGGRLQGALDPEHWDGISIYSQPDPTLPGYNPNEEHARIYPSLLSAPGIPISAAFALRDDLNVSKRLIKSRPGTLRPSDYTSDPFVLVEHRNRDTGSIGMTVYAVEREDPDAEDSRLLDLPGAVGNRYVFRYQMNAGERVTAPYPMNLVLGLSICANTVPDPFAVGSVPNGTVYRNGPGRRTYFVDHKGEGWAVSGDGVLDVHLFYRLDPDFWYPTSLLDPARSTGDCVPWLPTWNPILEGSPDRGSVRGAFANRMEDANYPTRIEFLTSWPTNAPTLKAGETLTFAGGEYKADHPEAVGLPGVVGWAAGEVVFDSLNPLMSSASKGNYTARVIAPLEERIISLPVDTLADRLKPAAGNVTVVGTEYRFDELPPSLRRRIFYDPLRSIQGTNGALGLRGYVNDRTLGDPDLTTAPSSVYVLEPNILTKSEVEQLRGLSRDEKWMRAVSNLNRLARNPGGLDTETDQYLAGLQAPLEYNLDGTLKTDSGGTPVRNRTSNEPLQGLGPGLALVPNPRFLDPELVLPLTNYVTLAENNHASLGDAPVALHVIRVVRDELYRGSIKTIASENVFDEKLSLRHTADFGGNVDEIAFSWWSREEDGRWKLYGPLPPGSSELSWRAEGSTNGSPALNSLDLVGSNPLLLADNLFFVRYRHTNSPTDRKESWSDWAGAANSSPTTNSAGQPAFRPQLATGWVKRVFNRLTPYEARFNDFRNNPSPATYASLIQQAGPPPRGSVALNSDKNVIESAGLLEIYQTVIDRAKALSIDATQPVNTPGIAAALMLGTTRISQLYKLLGDEAVSDAFDPTIGFGTSSTEYGKLAPTIFAFQNQVGSLLEEELALLRGLDEDRAWPVHNRLSWNFTRAEGEAAYAMNYGIRDVNNDGFINERDGQIQFPQGHGDAWGHYLSAIRPYYELLGNPNFNWQTRAEWFNQSDVVLPVDYLDERKFAELAGARANAGAEIVGLSLRALYTEDPWGQWQGYQDGDTNRAWGTMEWARRAGQAALLDWVVANALLPSVDTNHPTLGSVPETASGIQKLDRASVAGIGRISAALGSIQSTYDTANGRLNPLGLDPDVVPFDLDPTFVDVGSTAQIGRPAVQGLTHFEQIYERAFAAVDNATAAFDYATEQQNQLRRIGEDVESNRKQAIAQDTEFRNRLIEIFGTPYRGTIGTGKPYPPGYEGPDLSLWMYVDVQGVSKDTVPASSTNYSIPVTSFKADLVKLNEKFKNLAVEGYPRDFFNRAVANWDASLQSWTSVQLTDNSVLELNMPATARAYTFQAPSTWEERAAPGRLQSLISDMVQIEADLAYAVGDYDYLLNDIRRSFAILSAKVDLANSSNQQGEDQLKALRNFNDNIQSLQSSAAALGALADFTKDISDGIVEAIPKVLGVSFDSTAPIRSGIKIAAVVGGYGIMRSGVVAMERSAAEFEYNKEENAEEANLRIQRLGFSYEIEEQLMEIHQMMVNEGTTRIAVFRVLEQLRQKADEFRATLEEGSRLIQEREALNRQLAAATQENRYADFLLRNSRNEALQKYRAAFDLASRYTFLAAKAYDFETNFDPNDRLSPRPLLEQIVRERTLGQLLDGKPQHRGGLAGVLADLYENFRVIEGQLGFNNPQLEFNRFSLRKEKFGVPRIPDPYALDQTTRQEGESETDWKNRLASERKFENFSDWTNHFNLADRDWKTTLRTFSKSDLWEVPEFRRFCRPFAARGSPEPGLVIPFGTEVVAGRNFFGRELSPGDSAYDPSNFSTKIRSVRINLVDYDPSELALTPRVYLVPAGLDGMYVPNQSNFRPVFWNVSDQRIPVPVQTGPSDLARSNWLPTTDSLGGPLGEIRRFSSFRAYLEDADPDVMTRDTRLVGRSVWNTQWLLIVPGRSLLSDPEQGLERFIGSVSDITLAFETYGSSGN